jgi:hypothetical protein
MRNLPPAMRTIPEASAEVGFAGELSFAPALGTAEVAEVAEVTLAWASGVLRSQPANQTRSKTNRTRVSIFDFRFSSIFNFSIFAPAGRFSAFRFPLFLQ